MQKWTLTKIKKSLKELSMKGWIESNRRHDTGIGKTLEDHLGIKENNIALPDFGVMELKSQRIGTPSMITLFTKSPEGITNAEIRKRFGYPDSEFSRIKILHQTIDNGKMNSMGFHCKITEKQNKLFIMKKDEVLGFYDLDFLKQKAIEKIGNGLILVLAESKEEDGKEYFHYEEAYLLRNLDLSKLLSYSKYDIRLGVYHSGKNKGRFHDHGSAFRIEERSISKLFSLRKRIL
ncbi:MvaI/BcnI family restriction endonuclease [Patescibacteria group bacterium]|nr:MvaI/BcnI family restriction endonuclease [Patescibacteria group bacterium]MCL5114364.1 MvaI/BcnI family restriction endonuclease [Patescibacteria group bacterium]